MLPQQLKHLLKVVLQDQLVRLAEVAEDGDVTQLDLQVDKHKSSLPNISFISR